jgi:uncharacterized membrane protein YgcG
VAQVRVGDAHFDNPERLAITSAIRKAEVASRIEFSVFVGNSEGEPHAFATQLHNSLVAPSRTIVIMVDPERRALEIVTGGWVRERIGDAEVQAVAEEMAARFAEAGLAVGIVRGIELLAQKAQAHA